MSLTQAIRRNGSTVTSGSSFRGFAGRYGFVVFKQPIRTLQTTTIHHTQRATMSREQMIRHFASDSNVKQAMAARDTRLAGRQRFYRHVSVVKMEENSPSDAGISSIDSPISAGVDGTDSASGIHHRPSIKDSATVNELHARYLIPRPPGQSFDNKANNQEHDLNVDWYGVALDGHFIKTPMGSELQVPSRLLASQIAAEWNAVERYIQPTQMPAMTMTCTALDQTSQFAQQYQEQVLKFVPTDTLCFFADPLNADDRLLYQRQEQAWKKILDAIEQTVGTPMAKAMGTQEGTQLMMRSGGSETRGIPHSTEILDYARTFVESLDAWHLTALHGITHEAKSFWLGWALLMSSKNAAASSSSSSPSLLLSMFENHHGKDAVAQAVQAARIEEEFQIENWGLVEGGHDYDRLNTSVNLGAARLLCECLAVDNDFGHKRRNGME